MAVAWIMPQGISFEPQLPLYWEIKAQISHILSCHLAFQDLSNPTMSYYGTIFEWISCHAYMLPKWLVMEPCQSEPYVTKMCTSVCTYVCLNEYLYPSIFLSDCLSTIYNSICRYIHAHYIYVVIVCVCVCWCAYVCVCVCLHTHTHLSFYLSI